VRRRDRADVDHRPDGDDVRAHRDDARGHDRLDDPDDHASPGRHDESSHDDDEADDGDDQAANDHRADDTADDVAADYVASDDAAVNLADHESGWSVLFATAVCSARRRT
jgi:hypothetical protein